MRKTTLCALMLMPFAALAEPDAAYEPLSFLAGHCWKGTFPDGKQTDEHCFAWMYDGKFLRDRHVVRADGRADYIGESTYFWNSTAKQLEYLYIENKGGFSRGVVSPQDGSLVFPATNFVNEGKTQTYRSRWQRAGDGAYEVVTELQSGEAWKPWFKMRMEKVTRG
jgi:hypothetical protein